MQPTPLVSPKRSCHLLRMLATAPCVHQSQRRLLLPSRMIHPPRIKPAHAGPSTISVADLAALSVSAGSSTSSVDQIRPASIKDRQISHTRVPSGQAKQLAASACKFGEPDRSLRASKPSLPRESSSSMSASTTASATASASASDAEGPSKPRLPPPRPPKPSTSSHGVQILDDSDLERLAHMGSSSRVTSIANLFGSHSAAKPKLQARMPHSRRGASPPAVTSSSIRAPTSSSRPRRLLQSHSRTRSRNSHPPCRHVP